MDNVQPEQSPIVSYEQPVAQQTPPQPIGGGFRVHKKLLFIIGALIVLVVISGVILLRVKKSQPTVTSNLLLATVGDQKIYKSNVMEAAEEQYTAAAITPEVMKKFYPLIIERAILDQEASKLGITISDSQISNSISSNSAAIPTSMKTAKKYELIKQQIMIKQTKNVTAFTIGVWIASFDDPQLPIYATQRADTIKALDEIEKGFQNNIQATVIAKTIYDKYASIRPRLAVNGYIFEKTQNIEGMNSPKAYTLNPDQINNPAADKYLFAELNKIKTGQIVKVNRPDGTGGIVVNAVAVNGEGYATYAEFLTAKEKELVTTYASL